MPQSSQSEPWRPPQEKSLKALRELIDDGRKLSGTASAQEHSAWQNRAKTVLDIIFGKDSKQSETFNDAGQEYLFAASQREVIDGVLSYQLPLLEGYLKAVEAFVE